MIQVSKNIFFSYIFPYLFSCSSFIRQQKNLSFSVKDIFVRWISSGNNYPANAPTYYSFMHREINIINTTYIN